MLFNLTRMSPVRSISARRHVGFQTMLDTARLEYEMAGLSPDSRSRLRTYVAEADFFDAVLSDDLNRLCQGARLMEIGSGIGLLTLRAAAKGFKVTSYEPQSAGFSEMLHHREVVRRSWDGPLPDVEWRNTYFGPATTPIEAEKAVFAFAINVIEHVPDVESFITATIQALKPGGRFRFICPNYAFPYEPHFEIPTLLRKSTTFRVFQKRILASNVDDPLVMWAELSWPNVWKLSRMLRRMNLRHYFSRSGTKFYLNRVTQDATFVARKGPTVRAMFHAGSVAAPIISRLTPVTMLPIIDCTVYRDK